MGFFLGVWKVSSFVADIEAAMRPLTPDVELLPTLLRVAAFALCLAVCAGQFLCGESGGGVRWWSR